MGNWAEEIAASQKSALENERRARERKNEELFRRMEAEKSKPWRILSSNIDILYKVHHELLEAQLRLPVRAIRFENGQLSGYNSTYLCAGLSSGIYLEIPPHGYGQYFSSGTSINLEGVLSNKERLHACFDTNFYKAYGSCGDEGYVVKNLSLYLLNEAELRRGIEMSKPLRLKVKNE